ncbi:hypothetical protein C8A00DRAFT_38105, partial [Chaetomidium leptoderma]
MSTFEIPEPTANSRALAKRHPVDYQKLYQFWWDTFDDYEVPMVKDPSFTKVGGQSQDAIDNIIAEEEEALFSAIRSLYYYPQRESALRDMEGFDAPDYLSLTTQERANIDDFVREVQNTRRIKKAKGERLKPHESSFLTEQSKDLQVFRSIFLRLSAPESQWVGIMRHVAVEAARAVANPGRPKQRNPNRLERLVGELFDAEEWASSDTHNESIDSSEISQEYGAVVFPSQQKASELDRREGLVYRTLDISASLQEIEYREFIERAGRRELFDLLKRSVDASVWDNVLGAGRTTDKQYLQHLQEDNDSLKCPGWYIAVSIDPADAEFFK